MALLSEALIRLQMLNFVSVVDKSKYSELFQNVSNLQMLFLVYVLSDDSVIEIYCYVGYNESQKFQYWVTFIHKIMPVPCYLTQYYREGDWSLNKREKSQIVPQ